MSDEKTIDPDLFSIGHVGGDEKFPDSLLINFPIAKFATPGGMDEAVGKCRRIESIVVMLIKERFKKNQQTGGSPMSA